MTDNLEDKLSQLARIPLCEPPSEYERLLSNLPVAWFYMRAQEMISKGHDKQAIHLLQFVAPEQMTDELEMLQLRLTQLQRIKKIVMEYFSDVEDLPNIKIDMDLLELLKYIPTDRRASLAQALLTGQDVRLSTEQRLELLEIAIERCEELSLEPYLYDRIWVGNKKNLEEELLSLQNNPVSLKLCINRVLELIVARRNLALQAISLSSYSEMNRYQELGGSIVDLGELEEFCVAQLAELSSIS